MEGTALLPPYALEERERGACLSLFRWSATGFNEASEAVFGMTGTFRGRKVEEPLSAAGGGQDKSDMPVNYARISAFLHLRQTTGRTVGNSKKLFYNTSFTTCCLNLYFASQLTLRHPVPVSPCIHSIPIPLRRSFSSLRNRPFRSTDRSLSLSRRSGRQVNGA